jgi:hypothetical protein
MARCRFEGIGNAAVPDAILDKPGPLDDHEWALMRRQTVIAERIMQAAPALDAAAPSSTTSDSASAVTTAASSNRWQ